MDKSTNPINHLINWLIFGFGALSFNEKMMLVGIGLSALTYLTGVYFQYKRNKLLEREVLHNIAQVNVEKNKRCDKCTTG